MENEQTPGPPQLVEASQELMGQVRAAVTQTISGTPMFQVEVPHLDGYMSISFPVDDLLTYENEEFLEPVRVTASTSEYLNSVDTVNSVQGDENCSICLEKMEQSSDLTCIVVQTKCCGKLFHDRCLREHLCCVGPPKCPLCRYDMRDFSTEIIG